MPRSVSHPYPSTVLSFFLYLSIYLSIHLSTYLSISSHLISSYYLSIYLSIYLSCSSLRYVGKLKALVSTGAEGMRSLREDGQLQLIVAIKVADLGQLAKPLPLHKRWTRAIVNEFFEQVRLLLLITPFFVAAPFVHSLFPSHFVDTLTHHFVLPMQTLRVTTSVREGWISLHSWTEHARRHPRTNVDSSNLLPCPCSKSSVELNQLSPSSCDWRVRTEITGWKCGRDKKISRQAP